MIIIEKTLWEMISHKGRASKKLFEKIVLTKILKQDARIKELEEKVKELEEYKHRYESVSK